MKCEKHHYYYLDNFKSFGFYYVVKKDQQYS